MNKVKRNLQIKKMILNGFSYREIGEKFNITKQGVHKIMKYNFPEIKIRDKNERISNGMLNSKIFKRRRIEYVRVKNPAGYIKIRDGRKWVLEHRYIMEQYIGRKLDKKEHVHHRNAIKDDNKLENLELILIGKTHKGTIVCPYCSEKFSII